MTQGYFSHAFSFINTICPNFILKKHDSLAQNWGFTETNDRLEIIKEIGIPSTFDEQHKGNHEMPHIPGSMENFIVDFPRLTTSHYWNVSISKYYSYQTSQ